MKKTLIILLLLFSNGSFSQNYSSSLEVDIPTDFFNEMFRSPTDKHLVAWSGGVTVIVKNQSGNDIQIAGAIKTIDDYLNTELTNLARRQFKYNLNTPLKRITTPDGKSWVGHCGYDPYGNVTLNDIRNGKKVGWPPEITSEVWGINFSKQTSKIGYLVNNKTGEKEAVSVFFHASSIYYYHKIEPQNLKGKITRDDDYYACGTIKMHRLGPGHIDFDAETDVNTSNFDFQNQLFLGDYQVQYLWEDGTFQVLEQHIVYDPFQNPEDLEYELKTFEGKISGTLIDEETKKPVQNQKVTLKPVCSESGLPEFDTKSDQDGKFEFTEVPNGVYNVVTKGAPDRMAGLTKNPNLSLREIEVKQNSNYDILVTYTASGFAKAQLLWANATIRFPEKGEPIQKFDMVAFRNSGDYDHPTGTDGKPLKIPYSTVIPGIGLQTLYGWPENESAIPKVIFVASLGGYKSFDKFKINLEEDALNTCNISQDNNGPIYLDLNFDLSGRYPNSDVWQQVDVGCKKDKEWNMTKGNSLNGYPLAFKQVKFTDADIEKFKKSEDFEKTLSNGKATLKIEFKVVENL